MVIAAIAHWQYNAQPTAEIKESEKTLAQAPVVSSRMVGIFSPTVRLLPSTRTLQGGRSGGGMVLQPATESDSDLASDGECILS